MSRNEVKLQVLISKEIYNTLIERISKESLKKKQQPLPISAYVRNLIVRDLEK
jgi:hypothetical protein